MLKERVCIVTGAARGIGREFALHFAGLGARVVAADRLSCDATIRQIREASGEAVPATGDVTSAGDAAASAAAGASDVLFGGSTPLRQTSEAALAFVATEVPSQPLRGLGASVVDVLVDADLAQSRSEALRALAEGSVYINGERTSDPDRVVDADDLLHGRYVLLRRGKKRWHIATTP